MLLKQITHLLLYYKNFLERSCSDQHKEQPSKIDFRFELHRFHLIIKQNILNVTKKYVENVCEFVQFEAKFSLISPFKDYENFHKTSSR